MTSRIALSYHCSSSRLRFPTPHRGLRSQVSVPRHFGTVKDLEFLYVFNEGGTMTESRTTTPRRPGRRRTGLAGAGTRAFEAQ